MREAKQAIKQYLLANAIPFRVVTVRTVGFQDLARGSATFVTVKGWGPDVRARDVVALGQKYGVIVDFE